MLGLIAANLTRRFGRTLLTAMGIALGVATIVALLGLTAGLKKTAGGLVNLGGAEVGLFQKGVADPTVSVLPVSLVPRLERRPDVVQVTPLLLVVEALKSDPAALVFGADPRGFVQRRLVLSAGTRPATDRDIAIGDQLAGELGKSVGDTVAIKGRRLRVSGVYHSGVVFEDSGAIVDLGLAQRLLQRPGEATTIAVQVPEKLKSTDVARDITRTFPGTQAIGDPGQAIRLGANGTLISKAVLVIVVLALIVGGIGVTNTMVLSVIERQSELALLSTVGWSPRRVGALVLSEGVGISIIGAGIGLLLGVIGSDLLVRALGASSFVTPEVTAWGLGRGLLVGVAIGVFGGLYPAWRVTRGLPAQSLARVL